MEIEAKFQAPEAGVLKELAVRDQIAGRALDAGRTEEVVDIYLDTEGWDIYRGGFFCRLRLDGEGVLVTLKQIRPAQGAIHRREEHEIRLPEYVQPGSWPNGPARDKVLALAGAQPLRERLELRQTRTKRLVGDPENPIAELSLDVVRLTLGAPEAEPSRAADGDVDAAGTASGAGSGEDVYYEVEVEIREAGTEQDLDAIVSAMREAWPLAPQTRSKFERALEAAGAGWPVEAALDTEAVVASDPERPASSGNATAGAEEPASSDQPAPTGEPELQAEPGSADDVASAGEAALDEAGATAKPAKKTKRQRRESFLGDGLEVLEKPGLSADDTMPEAARKTLLYHLQKMMLHEPGTRDGEDPEELHDMRVATRRMRAALRVFQAYLDMEEYKPFLKAMRETGSELGAVRDLDVFMIKTQTYIDGLPPEDRQGLDPLVRAWRAERARARAELLGYLDSERYQRFKERFEAFLRVPGAGAGRTIGGDGEPLPNRVGDVLPGVIFDRLAHVKAYDGPISQPDAPLAVFHQLRITSKGLRYTLEFFQEVLGPDSKPLIDRTKRVQDHLGDLQDAVVTCDVLLGFLGSGTWGAPRGGKRSSRFLFPVNAPGVAAYMAVKQGEIERLMHTFGPTWDLMRGSEFSRPLAELVASL